MTDEQFDRHIQRLETEWRRAPAAFYRWTMAMVGLAYVYLTGLLVLSLGVILAMVWIVIRMPNAFVIKLAFIVGGVAIVVAASVIRGLWVRMEPPQGQPVRRDDAPELFTMLDDLSRRAGGPKFHRVLIDDALNAFVVQNPRLGLLGWHCNYLVLGLPLMQALTPDEFRSVIAHEFAHMSKAHGRSGNRLYRVRRTWLRIIEFMAKNGQSGFAVGGFLNWFWPRFNARAFVLSRANEYEADAFAADATSADAAASALTRLRLVSQQLERHFWDPLPREAAEAPRPPADVQARLRTALLQTPDPAETGRWLRAAFHHKTDSTDTHPCLRDRLASLNRLPAELPGEPPAPLTQNAAAFFLRPACEEWMMNRLSEAWQARVLPEWQERHRACRAESANLRRLEEQLADPELPASVRTGLLWNRLLAAVNLAGPGNATAALTELKAASPDHAGARFFEARLRVENGDAAAAPLLEQIMEEEPEFIQASLTALFQHYADHGDDAAIARLRAAIPALRTRHEAAEAERSAIDDADTFLPHELTAESLTKVTAFLSGQPVTRAWIVRKQTRSGAFRPHRVVLIDPAASHCLPGRVEYLMEKIAADIQLDGSWLVVRTGVSSAESRITAVPDSQVLAAQPAAK